VSSLAEDNTETVPEALFMDAFSFADGRLEDDLAIVALRRTGSPQSSPFQQGRLELGVA
jgi:hypothetical protein